MIPFIYAIANLIIRLSMCLMISIVDEFVICFQETNDY